MLHHLLRRPSFWIGLVAIIVYWDEQSIFKASWVYDDSGSVAKNVVVVGQVPWKEVFTRDFWGTSMKEVSSHKSFRPITTLTFLLNYKYNKKYSTDNRHNDDAGLDTTSFKLVNIFLHAIVCILVTEAAGYIFYSTNTKVISQKGNKYDTSIRSKLEGEGKSNTTDDNSKETPKNGSKNEEALLSNDTSSYYTWKEAQIITGVIFAVHPVHAEVVSNVTSRGEMLMSIFNLLAFISFAHFVLKVEERKESSSFVSIFFSTIGIYVFPALGMTLSLFSKEQGATTLITLVIWDFCRQFESVMAYLEELWKYITSKAKTSSNNRTIRMLRRTIVLAVQTMVVCLFRYWLNGETSPDFIEDQNPAGFASDRFTRIYSICWVYCLYIRDAIYPKYLCPDWSGISIDLIRTSDDERIWAVILLWIFTGFCLLSLVFGHQHSHLLLSSTVMPESIIENDENKDKEPTKVQEGKEAKKAITEDDKDTEWHQHPARRILLSAFFGFTFSPFLLSSNLLVVIGLMKADRVIYLPLLGFCILQGMIFQLLWNYFKEGSMTARKITTTSTEKIKKEATNNENNTAKSTIVATTDDNISTQPPVFPSSSSSSSSLFTLLRTILYWLYLTQIVLYTRKTHERNVAWHHSLNLWLSAYNINPRSHHTMYNCGYELSIAKRYREAEYVMRPIGNPRVDGPSNTFVYAMVLFNLQRCDVANPLIDDAIDVLQEQREDSGNPRNQPHMINRSESNLLVARAHCASSRKNQNTMDGMIAGMQAKGAILYQAVQVDPTNSYAIQQAQGMMEQIEQLQKAGYNIGLGRQ